MIKIYLVGVSDVGKSAVGGLLAGKLDFVFYDLDQEIEKYFGKPIKYLHEKFLSLYGYREETSVVLRELLNKKLSEKEKRLYLKEIKKDITFFNKFNNRADYEFSIESLKLENIPKCLIEFLESKNEEFKRYVTCAKGQHKKLDIFKIARQN